MLEIHALLQRIHHVYVRIGDDPGISQATRDRYQDVLLEKLERHVELLEDSVRFLQDLEGVQSLDEDL